MDILKCTEELVRAVEVLTQHARLYYYTVMLSGHACPKCGGNLKMIGESQCRCETCNHRFDPTVMFQRCTACGGIPRLRVCRYQCRSCGADVPSRFIFDDHAFDRDYFRMKMAESRQRKREQRAERARRSAGTDEIDRSRSWTPPVIDLPADLATTLDDLGGQAKAELEAMLHLARQFEGFDLERYETHLQAQIGPIEVCFDDIPALMPDRPRLDRIWRFVAMVFLAHGGVLRIYEENNEIWVRRTNAIDRKGSAVPQDIA